MQSVTVLVIGGKKVGKKSLLSRFLFRDLQHREESYLTLYSGISRFSFNLEFLCVRFISRDYPSEEDLIGIHGIVFLFSLQDEQSIYLTLMQMEAIMFKYPFLPYLVLGNKADIGEFIQPCFNYLPLSTWLDHNVSSLKVLLETIRERVL